MYQIIVYTQVHKLVTETLCAFNENNKCTIKLF